jgi:hypothetical protein
MEHFDERETQGRSPRKIKSAEQLNALIIFILMGVLSLIALFA